MFGVWQVLGSDSSANVYLALVTCDLALYLQSDCQAVSAQFMAATGKADPLDQFHGLGVGMTYVWTEVCWKLSL